jgi:hypothetical protein
MMVMPTKKFSLERGGPKRLEVSWKMMWRDIRIRLDGAEIGSIKNQKELTEGRDFTLPDGSKLNVKLALRGSFITYRYELQLLRDCKPLPESDSDPNQRLASSYNLVFFIGGLNILLGFIAIIFNTTFLVELGIGFFSILFGCVFLILGLFIKNRRSAFALGIAVTIMILDTLLVLPLSGSGSGAVGGMVGRLLFLGLMTRGFGAIRELKEEDKK